MLLAPEASPLCLTGSIFIDHVDGLGASQFKQDVKKEQTPLKKGSTLASHASVVQ
jgi:hypothetical protein